MWMIRLSVLTRRALAMVAVAAVVLGPTGCAKKIASVDPGYTSPEGTPSAKALLVVTQDIPVPYLVYIDEKSDGFTPDDTPDAANPYLTYASGPGAVIGTILDSTLASNYQVMRREPNGAYRVAQDFSEQPARRWLDTHWEAYAFTDPAPSGYQPPTYLGRGLLSGVVNQSSPLTNAALAGASDIEDIDFDYQGQFNVIDQQVGIVTYNPPDSIFNIKWTPLTGATGYWISVYQFAGDAFEFLRSTLPAPVYLGRSRNYLLVYVAAPANSYTIGDPADIVLTRRPILNRFYYQLRITAVGPLGEILAYTFGDNLSVVPGSSRLVGTEVKNTWNVTLPSAIRLRPGPQVSSTPLAVSDPILVRPARPGTWPLRGRSLTR
jgi:hypothetical protein